MTICYYYFCFFDLSLSRLSGDINGSKVSINCDTFCFFDLFFVILNIAVAEVDATALSFFASA